MAGELHVSETHHNQKRVCGHQYMIYTSTGYGYQSCSWSAEQSCPRSRLRAWSRELGSAVLSRGSLLIILYTQAEYNSCNILLHKYTPRLNTTPVFQYNIA